jgi:hypothetical protein
MNQNATRSHLVRIRHTRDTKRARASIIHRRRCSVGCLATPLDHQRRGVALEGPPPASTLPVSP